MTRFRTHLERLDASLTLPQPRRAQVLEELAADLEDLYRRLRADGVPAGEAERRALHLLLPDDYATRELEAVHRPLWSRLVSRFTDAGRSRVERAAVVALTLLTTAFALAGLPLSELLLDPSPFHVPVLALGCAGLAAAAIVAARLFIRGVASPADGARGLDVVLFFACAAPLLGGIGLLLDLYVATGRIAADPAIATAVMTRLLRADGTLLASALVLGLATALCWLLLRTRVATLLAAAGALRRPTHPAVHDAARDRDVA
jgi:hypothetical protein